VQDHPGKCPKCGMELVPKSAKRTVPSAPPAKDAEAGTASTSFAASVEHPYTVPPSFLRCWCWRACNPFLHAAKVHAYVESPLLGIVTESPEMSAEEMETYLSGPI